MDIFRLIFANDESRENAEAILDEEELWYDYDSGDRMMVNHDGLNAIDEAGIDFDEI